MNMEEISTESTKQQDLFGNETKENTEIFEEVSIEQVPTEQKSSELDDVTEEPVVVTDNTMVEKAPEMILGNLSDGTQYDIIFLDDEKTIEKTIDRKVIDVTEKVYTISTAEVAAPRTADADNNMIAPLESKSGKKFYTSKLNLTFDHSTYKSVLPNVKWFVNIKDGKTVLNPWFNIHYDEKTDEKFVSVVSNLYFKLCKFLGKELGEMTQSQFTKSLAGKKVRLAMTKGIYEKRTWTRIDVAEFVKE